MSYDSLKKIKYKYPDRYDEIYETRYNSEYAHHIDFQINEHKAFFVVTPDIQNMMISIYKIDKKVHSLCNELPRKAIEQYYLRCLIDELVVTNNIEGVVSTRKELGDTLEMLNKTGKKAKFKGLVQKYLMLFSGERISLDSCLDIRKIYDELVFAEISESNKENIPDGEIFRKDSVSVKTITDKEIHRGLYPESKIIEAINIALKYLNDENEDLIYRTAVFHYMLGYIHPFYDGNGRLDRFISSYMISKELEPVLSYRLSYTIKENIKDYYAAFNECNSLWNKGDLTPFVQMFVNIILESISSLFRSLKKRRDAFFEYYKKIESLPYSNDKTCVDIYYYLVQAELFSEHGISMKELMSCLEKSRDTIKKRLNKIDAVGLLKAHTFKNELFYGIYLDKIN